MRKARLCAVFLLFALTACVKKEATNEPKVYAEDTTPLNEVVVEEAVTEYTQIELFNSVLEPSQEYAIEYLGRSIDQLYYAVKNKVSEKENNTVRYDIYRVSYDFETVTLSGSIQCDYVPREEHTIYLNLPKSNYDVMEIMIYSQDTVYFYDLKGALSRSYVVFGEGDYPWSSKMDIKGDVSDWYVSSGMALILFRDEEGLKEFNGLNETTMKLTDAPATSTDKDTELQQYADDRYGRGTLMILNIMFTDSDTFNLPSELGHIQKILYEDAERTLLMMEGADNSTYYLKVLKEQIKHDQQILQIELSTSTQSVERNMVITPRTKLPTPHWTENLQFRILGVQDPILEREIVGRFSNAIFYQDPQDIVFTVPVAGVREIELPKNAFEELGYQLAEAIKIEYTGTNLEYDLIRWNKDRTEKLLYMDAISDDYFAVELDFKDVDIDKAQVERIITANIDDYETSLHQPDIDYQWLDEKSLFVLVTNMEPGQDYCISMNGYITSDGSCHYSWESCHGAVGALEEYFGGIYDFTKSTVTSFGCVEYDAKSQHEKKLDAIDQYYDYIGPSAGALVATAMNHEWGYYCYIYDMDKKLSYDKNLFCTNYNDFFRYNEELYLLAEDAISRIDENGEVVKVFEVQKGVHLLTVRKNPIEDLLCVIVVNDENQFSLEILDDTFDLVRESDIEYWRLGFYGMLLEPYWLDSDSILLTGSSEQDDFEGHFVTKVYNVNSGMIEGTIEHKKVMTVSPDGEYILMQDEDNGEKISIYDKAFRLLGETELETYSYNPSYQYMDYWYGHILYLKFNDRNEILKWNLDTDEIKNLELPYEKFIINRVLDEDVFKLFLDVDILRRSNPFWS